MKFAKENLAVLISGAVAVLILIFAFAPIPYSVTSFRNELTDEMSRNYDQQSQLIDKWALLTLELPGVPPGKGVPSQAWVDAKTKLINDINKQQKDVETLARQSNARNRLNNAGVPLLPLPQNVSLSPVGKAIPNFLPKRATASDPIGFREDYGQQFEYWRGILALGQFAQVNPDAALPPRLENLKAQFEEEQRKAAAKLAPGAVAGGALAINDRSPDFLAFLRREITNQAARLHMYIEEGAFQVRGWYHTGSPPDDPQIFEALVDSWFQADLVKAIHTVNGNNTIAAAPVKCLRRVMIGNNARVPFLGSAAGAAGAPGVAANVQTEPGSLFFTSSNAGLSGPTGIPVVGPSVQGGNQGRAPTTQGSKVNLPDVLNQTSYDLGMTGRAAGKMYDVVYMSVVLDIDPAALFKFVESLYRQNMSYTVTNMQMRAVDPLIRAANGYLYGDTPVVEVELLVECILFRSWTEPLMPDDIKIALGGS